MSVFTEYRENLKAESADAAIQLDLLTLAFRVGLGLDEADALELACKIILCMPGRTTGEVPQRDPQRCA